MTIAVRILPVGLAVAGLLATLPALADSPDLAPVRPPGFKPAPDAPMNIPSGRQVGDTVESPFVVPQIPYETTGTTTGFTDDYDEACPYEGSTSPDVVYAFTVVEDSLYYMIDMCGSGYDTKIYVYDAQLELLACNDDAYFGDPCGMYVSAVEDLYLEVGATYYLVIDGYGGDHGDYVLEISSYERCFVEQPAWAWLEGEPPLVDGYVDTFNGGCNTDFDDPPFRWFELVSNAERWGLWGTSGWYETEGLSRRDTDWIALRDRAGFAQLTLVFVAERPSYAYQLWPHDCAEVEILHSVELEPCVPETMTVTQAPGLAWIWVGPQGYEPPSGNSTPFEYHYSMEVLEYQHAIAQMVPPEADYTLGCPTLPPGESAWGSWNAPFTNQFELPPDDCYDGSTTGPDMVFEFYVEAGGGFVGEIGHAWYPLRGAARDWNYPVYIVDDARMLPGSCVAVAETMYPETWISFWPETSGFYYLIYDQREIPYSIHFHAHVLDSAAPPDPPANDDCAGAVTIPPGVIDVADDLTTARNRFDPGRDGCSGPGGTGRDVVYRVPMTAGQTLAVTMLGEGDWDEELYVVADCADPMNSCVAGGTPNAEGGMDIVFTADSAADYWLVCDSYGVGDRAFVLTGSLTGVTATPELPAAVSLGPCHPNPFNPRTTIAFALPTGGPVRLAVHDMRGRLVATLHEGFLPAGRHEVVWDGRDLRGRAAAAGAYLVRLVMGSGTVRTEKVMLVR